MDKYQLKNKVIVITVENRLAYYEALDQWTTSKNTKPFIQLLPML